MRSPFSKSKPSFFKRSSSSSSTPSDAPPSVSSSPQPRPLEYDSFEKISVASEPLSSPSSSNHRSPPRCRVCNQPCTLLITRSSNRNGNAGRPYYKCVPDGVFACFVDGDGRGEAETNPMCSCGVSSKRQLSSREKGRKIFYTCSSGNCDFFQFHRKPDGTDLKISDDVAEALANLKVV